MDRLSKVTDPLGKFETFTYDGNGNLLSAADRKGQTITFEYDAANQLIKKTIPGDLVTSFDYDLGGNLKSVIDPDSALAFVYDAVNRLVSASTVGSPNQPVVDLAYAYDKKDNRTLLADSVSGGSFIEYQTRAFDRLTSMFLAAFGSNITFSYDNLNQRSQMTLPNGVMTNYTYDVASQLTGLTHRLGSASPFSSFSYTYDNVGNRTANNQQRSAVTVAPTLSYIYDDLYRLTQATNPVPALPDESFSYDPLGNRQNKNSLYDDANRLIDNDDFSYSYDDNGNLTQKTDKSTGEITDYLYDAENQLVEIQVNSSTVAQYRYDGLGRRIEKATASGTTRYVYDNEDILFEFDGSNNVLARYVHGPGIDEPLVMERGGQLYYYHADGLGTIMELTDSTGTVAQSYVYDAFGQIITQGSGLVNPYTFTGRERDEESGLYHYRFRYYDPTAGRFINEDPLGFADGMNPYSYVHNNPINTLDPFGLTSADNCYTLYEAQIETCKIYSDPRDRATCFAEAAQALGECLKNADAPDPDPDDGDSGNTFCPTPQLPPGPIIGLPPIINPPILPNTTPIGQLSPVSSFNIRSRTGSNRF